ncbi:inorganic phosphate transporter, PiT family [Corynebacterium coyleae]|uniref:Phosphate transporter n=1 Tax=Corynebacterium coyleae TaxID=53374 RepID=A0ABX8KZW9_9CORY|nr:MULTISPECIES: inorganic phosphate transporter [Corynebacterium]PLA37148.1 inorganic phosphate transporter [Corynebacterium coyleae]QXB19314.1 inorganic phosphate transporter [Corynebacterium coyleae]UBI09305.1 inorganic phosphate transporter [Corynebacterium coyleae]WJY80925.1 Low-affinity inorganic phosphate transporter 1 [Corynebacterium coyleae]SEB52884.1 inorganic phosphate transporter, PiT family [Corynebacterium coyleae]
MSITILLVLIIVVALFFDFTNGFHDTANAMATSIATGALKPKTAVALAGILNLIGAFLSVAVAKTVANGIVKLDVFDLSDTVESERLLLVVFAGLTGAILWNLFTWLYGIPSSSSHALFGGLIGAAIAAIGWQGVVWGGVLHKIILPALFAPFVAGLVAMIGTWLVYRLTSNAEKEHRDNYFRWGQIGTASLVALAHGTSDAQKTMGVIFLAMVAAGQFDSDHTMPFWIQASCALAIAIGTYSGGFRVIRTLGKGLVEIHPPQGMAAETSSAAIILTSSHLGMALSTTHVATGSIMGSGLTGPKGEVRWGVAGRMAIAWITTLPIAAFVAFVTWWAARWVSDLGGDPVWGGIMLAVVLVICGGYMFIVAQREPVHRDNVNDDWESDSLIDEPTTPHRGEPAHIVDTTRGLDHQ